MLLERAGSSRAVGKKGFGIERSNGALRRREPTAQPLLSESSSTSPQSPFMCDRRAVAHPSNRVFSDREALTPGPLSEMRLRMRSSPEGGTLLATSKRTLSQRMPQLRASVSFLSWCRRRTERPSVRGSGSEAPMAAGGPTRDFVPFARLMLSSCRMPSLPLRPGLSPSRTPHRWSRGGTTSRRALLL